MHPSSVRVLRNNIASEGARSVLAAACRSMSHRYSETLRPEPTPDHHLRHPRVRVVCVLERSPASPATANKGERNGP